MMKKLLSVVVLWACIVATMYGGESKDYAVKTTKAPVWIYQDATSYVAGYLDHGTVPVSELQKDDPQWIHVKHNGLEGWSHVLAFGRNAKTADIEAANRKFADYLRKEGAEIEVIETCTSAPAAKSVVTVNGKEAIGDNAGGGLMEPYSVRGLEPMFIYVIDKDVECPVNEAYAYHGKAIRIERTSETFSGGTWFACENAVPDGLMLMSQGKGFDVPPSAYHLLTEDEYLAYMNHELRLVHINVDTTLKDYLETHDVAQAKDWNVDFKQYTRTTLTDLWPILVPLLFLLMIFIMGMRSNANPAVWAYAAIADLLVFCAICWKYISMPSVQFNDLGGLAWIPIVLVALLAMALILFVSWRLGLAALARYGVDINLKSVGVGFGIGVALCIVLDIVLIQMFGFEKNSATVYVVNMLCFIGGILGWTVVNLIRQNPAVAATLPAVLILWAIAITLGLALIAIAFFVVFFFVLWLSLSGNLGGGKNVIPGLVGSERPTCSGCRHFGSVQCPRSNPSGSDTACSSFDA